MAAVVRTCIGCRQRTETKDLVRFTAVRHDSGWVLEPDADVAQSGRGAHLHRSIHCLELAGRRKAFRRALKIEGEVDSTFLSAAVRLDPKNDHNV